MIPPEPVTSASAWKGPALRERRDWIHELSPPEIDEVRRAADRLRSVGRSDVTMASAGVPLLARSLSGWRRELESGLGFVLVRGMPVGEVAPEEMAKVYFLLGLHLGDPVPQNAAGDLVCDIRDTGADPKDPNVRLYSTRAEQDFHTDGADIIGVLCLKAAKSGGVSRIVSSVSVYNEVLDRRPDLAPLLFESWYFHLHGQGPSGMPAYFIMPICRHDGRNLATFFIGWYIRRAQGLEGVPPLSPDQLALLELYESVANDPATYLDMSFQPGDIQWLKNSVILHKRTEYEDWPEPERKRHLLRLWIAASDFEDGDDLLRVGIDPEKARAYTR